jgi:GT2 family glycosyltransferase
MSPRPRLLLISHDLGGGVERHVRDLRALLAAAADVDLLHARDASTVVIEAAGADPAWWRFEDWDDVVAALAARGYDRLGIHHVHGFAPAILELPARLGLPYDLTIHDFYPYCPIYSLSTPDGDYCGEPDAAGCARCLLGRPHPWGLDIASWRERMHGFLAGAARVIVPSRFVAGRLARHFPDVACQVQPHPPRREWLEPVQARVKVGLLGGLSAVKGLATVLASARLARDLGQPLAYCVLGYPSGAIPTWPELPIQVRGEYRDADLPELLALERFDVLWFPGRIPETYSYTLDVALASGLPIVASDLGAVAERLRDAGRGTLLPAGAPAGRWNEALLAAAAGGREAPAVAGDADRRRAWLDWFLAPVTTAPDRTPAAAGTAGGVQVLAQAPAPARTPLPLEVLYEHGVECGHRESRLALKSRLEEVSRDYAVLADHEQHAGKPWYAILDQAEDIARPLREELALRDDELATLREELEFRGGEIDALRGELDEVHRELLQLRGQVQAQEQDLARARGRIAELEASTSWRVTAPLRSVGTGVLRLRRAFARFTQRARYVRQRVPLALHVLAEDGPAALAARVRAKLRAPRFAASVPAPSELVEIGALRLETCDAGTQPAVSIVIPVYGHHDHTFNCLRSLERFTALARVEIIVVDDASPEPAAQALAGVEGVRFLRAAVNGGFIASCNLGAAAARGEFLVLLNNDIQVTEGWLGALLAVFDSRPDAGLVGARLVYPDGRLQEAGGIVWRDGSAWNWGRGDDPEKPPYRYLRAVDYCSGACLALRTRDWQALEGFDRAYAPAYYEDTDLAFRVRRLGKRVYYQPEATIIHFEGISSGTDENQGVKRHQVINRETFLARWQGVLATHRPNAVEPALEADRAAAARVLVIEACMITPDHDSGSVRMQAMLELMVGLGCKVSFVADNLEYRQPYVRALQQAGVEVWHHPFVPSVEQLLQEHGDEYELVMICRHYIAARYIDAVRARAPRARIVFDTVDLHYLREQRLAELEQSATLAAAAATTRRQELGIIARSDITLVVSPVEQELLAAEAPGADVRVLSNIHELRPAPRPYGEREGLLFVGGFRHPPNVDAVNWFVAEVWPAVRARLPGVELGIVGSNMPAAIRELAVDGVRVLGYVEDIDPLLDAARISIAPLRYGAGVKGKINQAMAFGLPVVATPMAAEGMGLRDGEELLVAESPQDFADAIVRLYGDEPLWQRLAEGGRDNVRRHFSRAHARATLAAMLGLPPS